MVNLGAATKIFCSEITTVKKISGAKKSFALSKLVTLTFDPRGIPRSKCVKVHLLAKFNDPSLYIFELWVGQTDRQADN